jgi:hypothetical protein
MLLRFTDDSFDEHIQSTIGVDFKVKHLDMNGKRVKLTIWDTGKRAPEATKLGLLETINNTSNFSHCHQLARRDFAH